jgi:hypothetical protein
MEAGREEREIKGGIGTVSKKLKNAHSKMVPCRKKTYKVE